MFSILHISDLHFGPPYRPEVGAALLDQAAETDFDLLIVSGDFTQRARREQFEQARSFLDRLPDVARIVVPGNHDVPLYRIWERLTAPHELYKQYISERLNTVLVTDSICLVGLDSTAPRRAITNGRISRDQLDFCRCAFADAPPNAFRAVVAHHHFAPAPDYERTEIIPGAQRALDLFEELGVEVVFAGHLHRSYIGNSLDIYPGENRNRGIVIAQCGTSTSQRGRTREREKNTINLIEVDETMLAVTHMMHFDHTSRFEPISRHIFPRRPHVHLPHDPAWQTDSNSCRQ